MVSGEAVMVSENFSRLRGGKLGEIIEIPTPSGILRLPIAGIVRDFSDQQGSVMISRQVFNKAWNDDSVNVFRLYLRPGADGESVAVWNPAWRVLAADFEGTPAKLPEFAGLKNVLVTHPRDALQPAALERRVELPAGSRYALKVAVAAQIRLARR